MLTGLLDFYIIELSNIITLLYAVQGIHCPIFLLHRKFLQISYAIKSPPGRMHTREYCILSSLPTALGARVSQAKLFPVCTYILKNAKRVHR